MHTHTIASVSLETLVQRVLGVGHVEITHDERDSVDMMQRRPREGAMSLDGPGSPT